MMILNVNQMLAKANHEKISEKILYLTPVSQQKKSRAITTYQSLNVEEEHPNDAMTGTVQLEKVHQCVLAEQRK
jgi:hypothetical protein